MLYRLFLPLLGTIWIDWVAIHGSIAIMSTKQTVVVSAWLGVVLGVLLFFAVALQATGEPNKYRFWLAFAWTIAGFGLGLIGYATFFSSLWFGLAASFGGMLMVIGYFLSRLVIKRQREDQFNHRSHRKHRNFGIGLSDRNSKIEPC